MPIRVLSISPAEPREDRVREAVEVLEAGGVVALPTETFYGLAANAMNPDAVARLNRLKNKAEDAPALLLLSDRGQVSQVAADPPASFRALTEMFWPGPLTLVVPAAAEVTAVVSGGRGTVGVRVPGLSLPRRIAAGLGHPITGVSANLHGEPACRTALEVSEVFPEGIELILDGGPAPGGLSSTVLDLCETGPRVLREGAIPISALEPYLAGLR